MKSASRTAKPKRNTKQCTQMTIKEFHKRIQTGKKAAQRKAVEEIAPEIEEKNREQLMEGRSAFGTQIIPSYKSLYYARKKYAMNSRPGFGVPDLRLSGKFHAGIKARLQGLKLDIDSKTTAYAKYLKKRYSGIFGLTPANFAIIKNKATHYFVQIWKKEAGI